MEVIGWIWWLVASFLGILLSAAWFLLGGWVSTLAQIAVIVLIVFGYKYGWRRAPSELLSRLGSLTRFSWGWIRSSDGVSRAAAPESSRTSPSGRRDRRRISRRQPGDVRINVSTCMTLLMLTGLWLMAATLSGR